MVTTVQTTKKEGNVANKVKEIWKSGKAVVNAWLAIPSGFSAEMIAQCGFDSVTVDMQHGVQDYLSMVQCFQAMDKHPITPMVRVPWNEPGIIGKVLDGGAYGVICPMVNTPQEARNLVSYAKYPPKGVRSNGPIRAGMYGTAGSYQKTANDDIVLLPMMETKTAIENMESILDVEGINGVYIGPSDLGLSHDAARELRADDRAVPQRLAPRQPALCIEQREPRGGARAARRAVDLPVGEHRHVPLRQRPFALLLPEDDPVHVAELALERVDDVVCSLERGLQLSAECDQARQLARLDPLLERCVERAAEREVDDAAGGLDPLRPDERGYVAEPHRADATVLHRRPRLEPAGRNIDDDACLPLAPLDDAFVQRPRDERDRPVPACRRVALVVEEHDPEVGTLVVGRDDMAAVHVGVAAGLVHEQPPERIELRAREAAALEDRRPLERRDAAGDDAERLTARVVVDDRDDRPAHGVSFR